MTCVSCKEPVPKGAKFCPECGVRLEQGHATAAQAFPESKFLPMGFPERRIVTVMFCDLVGSAALSARLDAEDLREVLITYHQGATEIVETAGGVVAQFLGDGVLAYFGYPTAHEDDAEQAIRAGLRLVQWTRRATTGGERLRVRVGIATGTVIVGDLTRTVGADEHPIIGETPYLAARLQALADADTVIISMSTQQLTGGLFSYRDLGPQALKGFDEPVQAWHVLGASDVASRFEALRSDATPLMGRDSEIELLLRHWAQAKVGSGCTVIVSGEAGIGKSRLTAALRSRLGAEAYTRISYFCSPQHQDSALYPVIRQLVQAAGIEQEDGNEEKLVKLEALLTAASPSLSETMPLMAALLSIPLNERYETTDLNPQRQKERTLTALLDQLCGLAAKQPVLIVFEDIHWIDPTSMELLSLAIDRVAALPILLIITARPEFAPPWPSQRHVSKVTLDRLRPQDGQAIAQAIAKGKSLPSDVLKEIISRSDGVPLFIEELTKTVLESGQIKEEDNRFTLVAPLQSLAIPLTLHASLLARLDRLPSARNVALTASAIGREFSYRLVAAVSGLPDRDLKDALNQLVTAELIFGRGVARESMYVFKHALVQGAAYDSLLRSTRQRLHADIATNLEMHFPEAVERNPELIAYHCTQAGQDEKAVIFWERAGRISLAKSAMVEAAAQLRQGLALLPKFGDGLKRQILELDMLNMLGKALVASKGAAAEETGQVYARARQLCHETGNITSLAPILSGQAAHHLHRGEYRPARRIAEELLHLDRQTKGTPSAGNLSMMGASLFWLGEFESSVDYLRRVLDSGESLPKGAGSSAVYNLRATALSYLSWDLFALGFIDQAVERMEEAIRWSRSLKRPHVLAFSLGFAAVFHLLRRAETSALDVLDELEILAVDQHFPYWLSQIGIMRGQALAVLGWERDGATIALKGFTEQTSTGSSLGQTFYLALAAQARFNLGDTADALNLLGRGLAMAEATGEHWYEAELHRLKGEWMIASDQSLQSEGASLLRTAFSIAEKQKARMWSLRAAMSLARMRIVDGRGVRDLTAVRDLLASVYSWFPAGLDAPDLRECKALLDESSR